MLCIRPVCRSFFHVSVKLNFLIICVNDIIIAAIVFAAVVCFASCCTAHIRIALCSTCLLIQLGGQVIQSLLEIFTLLFNQSSICSIQSFLLYIALALYVRLF